MKGLLAARILVSMDEVLPDMVIEVCAVGIRQQQLLISPWGNVEVMIDCPASEFQFQKSPLVLIVSGRQQGGVQIDSWHGLRRVAPGKTWVWARPLGHRRAACVCAGGVCIVPSNTACPRTTCALDARPERRRSAEERHAARSAPA